MLNVGNILTKMSSMKKVAEVWYSGSCYICMSVSIALFSSCSQSNQTYNSHKSGT